MSILYLVVDKTRKEIKENTKSSVEEILKDGDELLFKIVDDNELLYSLKPEKEYDYVCLIPNNADINENYAEILEDYLEKREGKEIIYLPLVVLLLEKTKGVLNNCVWNSNIADEHGVLTSNLAKMQIDTTMFGALIPYKIFFDKENYNEKLKYYQHFYFFNKTSNNENILIFGVPKVAMYTDIDLSYSDVKNEEKIEFFKEARNIKLEEAVAEQLN